MLVLSVGMPRAGSGWHYNLVHDLVEASGGQNARAIRERYRLQNVLTEVNCNIRTLSAPRLARVMLPTILGNTFAIKLHGGPKPLAEFFIQAGMIKPIYIYRDPRAAMLSAYEYGQRGGSGFKHLDSIDAAMEFMVPYLDIWTAWTSLQKALVVRYEDMLTDYDKEAARLTEHLSLDAADDEIGKVFARYRPGQSSSQDKGLHFHKGDAERFRTALTQEELEMANLVFGKHLERMGYQI